MVENKDAYSPQEVGEVVRDILEIRKGVQQLRDITIRNPKYSGSEGNELIRQRIREKYAGKIPENVRTAIGLSDVLQID